MHFLSPVFSAQTRIPHLDPMMISMPLHRVLIEVRYPFSKSVAYTTFWIVQKIEEFYHILHLKINVIWLVKRVDII